MPLIFRKALKQFLEDRQVPPEVREAALRLFVREATRFYRSIQDSPFIRVKFPKFRWIPNLQDENAESMLVETLRFPDLVGFLTIDDTLPMVIEYTDPEASIDGYEGSFSLDPTNILLTSEGNELTFALYDGM